MVDAVPSVPSSQVSSSSDMVNAIKIATPDLIIFKEDLPVEGLAQIAFENIAAQELISITRNNLVDGQSVSYSLVGNLKQIQDAYNTRNIFTLSETGDRYFQNFGIRFSTHVPEVGSGPEELRAYIVPANSAIANRGDLIIDVVNMEINERVDIEILRSGESLGDTIYVEES